MRGHWVARCTDKWWKQESKRALHITIRKIETRLFHFTGARLSIIRNSPYSLLCPKSPYLQ